MCLLSQNLTNVFRRTIDNFKLPIVNKTDRCLGGIAVELHVDLQWYMVVLTSIPGVFGTSREHAMSCPTT